MYRSVPHMQYDSFRFGGRDGHSPVELPAESLRQGFARLASFVLALARCERCTLIGRSPALTGTYPGTLPLSGNAAELEQP